MRKVLFIDRDGVINSDVGHYYIYKVEDFKLNIDVVKSLKLMVDDGFDIIVITNQGGVAKGVYNQDDVNLVHAYFVQLMTENDIPILDIFYCPHHNSVSECDCRKPKPGMILEAMDKYQIDPRHGYFIGDSARDAEAGMRAGLRASFKIEKNTSIFDYCEIIIRLEELN